MGPNDCFLCEQEIERPDERAEYDATDEPFRIDGYGYGEENAWIVPIHRECGDADNEARAEAAYFATAEYGSAP